MAKSSTTFVCASCSATHSKWSGKCDACGEWNTITEETARTHGPTALGTGRGKGIALTDLATDEPQAPRLPFSTGELDRVLGGGLVPASVVLLGGDPGIGKSTLLLQAAAKFAGQGNKTLYISGEEATQQIRLRAARLDLSDAPVSLAADTSLRDILATLEKERPALAIIDSIQTMYSDRVDSAPGSVSQLRAACHELVAFAKSTGTAVILVGHVTKEGQIAGPRVVEHMVDTVLYFEGERGHPYRILRAVKNRFGPADEIGVFEMTGKGLVQVPNPSQSFLSARGTPPPGAAVFAGIEGSRPLLVEFQALVAEAPPGNPRRSTVGWDGSRLAMLLAVLDARAGISFAGLDVYLNVAGGLKVSEPAADLAVAMALLSARLDTALPNNTVFFGEIALSGALRPATQTDQRLREAAKLGFSDAILPKSQKKVASQAQIRLIQHEHLTSVVDECFGPGALEKR